MNQCDTSSQHSIGVLANLVNKAWQEKKKFKQISSDVGGKRFMRTIYKAFSESTPKQSNKSQLQYRANANQDKLDHSRLLHLIFEEARKQFRIVNIN